MKEKNDQKQPASFFSLVLLILMILVIIFMLLVQNIDRFSSYFGSTTFKIVFDVALVVGLVLFAAYIFNRSARYNKRLESMVERLNESNTLLSLLNAIQSRANATLDSQGLLEESLEATMPLTSSIGTIYLLDENTNRLEAQAHYGTNTLLEDIPSVGLGEGVIGRAAESGLPVEDSGEGGAEHRKAMTRYALPVKTGNKVMGVMVAVTTKGYYSDQEKTLFQAVSEVLGNSLTNSKLYSLTRRALDASKRTQSYLDSFIRDAHMGVLVLDEKGTVMIANHEVEQFLGVQQKDLLGQPGIEALIGLGQRGQTLSQGFQTCFKDRKSLRFTQTVLENPSHPSVILNVFPLFGGNGELIGAAATIASA